MASIHEQDKHGHGKDDHGKDDKDHGPGKEGKGGGPEITPFTSVLASGSNADGATTTTSSTAYVPSSEVRAMCTISATAPPSQPCRVRLQLSNDGGTTWKDCDVKLFGLGAGLLYLVNFSLSKYVEKAMQFGVANWTHFRLVFSGNVGAPVTIQADSFP